MGIGVDECDKKNWRIFIIIIMYNKDICIYIYTYLSVCVSHHLLLHISQYCLQAVACCATGLSLGCLRAHQGCWRCPSPRDTTGRQGDSEKVTEQLAIYL